MYPATPKALVLQRHASECNAKVFLF